MSSYWLKLIALAAMFIDHMGLLVYPDMEILRMIGRLTMPMMCFFIGVGYRHTRNVKKYMGRLLLFAFLSEIPFDIAITWGVWYPYSQNVFFTLALGLLAIALFEKYRNGVGGLLVLLCGYAADFLYLDYGFYGVLLVVALYLWGTEPKGIWMVLIFLNVFFYFGEIQMLSILAAIPLSLYNGQRGPNLRYSFYLFYPVHLLFLAYLTGAFSVPLW